MNIFKERCKRMTRCLKPITVVWDSIATRSLQLFLGCKPMHWQQVLLPIQFQMFMSSQNTNMFPARLFGVVHTSAIKRKVESVANMISKHFLDWTELDLLRSSSNMAVKKSQSHIMFPWYSMVSLPRGGIQPLQGLAHGSKDWRSIPEAQGSWVGLGNVGNNIWS